MPKWGLSLIPDRAVQIYVVFVTAIIVISQSGSSAQVGGWPRYDAQWAIDIFKVAGAEPDDLYWLDLASPGATVTVGVRITFSDSSVVPLDSTGIQIRYLAHGVPVSGWLSSPFTFTLALSNPALDPLADGLHDLSLDVQGPLREKYRPRPVYLHLARGRAVSPLVPIMGRDCQYCDYGFDWGPGVVYVNPASSQRKAYPVDPTVSPWHGSLATEDLYQEEMAPHTNHFFGMQMWWEQAGGPHQGSRFTRALLPKWDEDHRGLRVMWKQERLPFIDGPRGRAWTSPYVTGQIDSTGGFAFAESGGPVRYMKPDGEVVTVAGWRVKPARDPIWVGNPVGVVRQNMELRGTWLSGQYPDNSGFHTPLDVAIDPLNEKIWYVAGYEDHCIWKLEILDSSFNDVRVSVLAGSPSHTPGYVDSAGAGARFNGPASLVFDPVADAMYVADQDNDAIRRVTRDGSVTTLFGGPGMGSRLTASGVPNIYDQDLARAASKYEVTAAQATAGIRPDVYMPQTVRVDSQGNLILLELGYGAIRRLKLTGESKHLISVYQRFDPNSRGWAWLDVDRWGNSGPLDGIYFCVFQQSWVDGEPEHHTNETYGWVSPAGAPGQWLFSSDWDPYPDGWGLRTATDPPHYGWLVAVDPRGAVLIAGGGEHGITRLRKRKAGDPVPPAYIDYLRGKELWRYGGLDVWPSFALKFGWEGHGYLGFADAWDLKDAADGDLINAFEIPPAIQADTPKLQTLLNFIRLNGGHQVTVPGGYVPPPPEASPSPAPPVTPPATPPPAPPPATPPDTPPPPPEATPPAAPPAVPGGCLTPDPFKAIGGGTCWDGGWLPPGMLPPGVSPAPPVTAPPPAAPPSGGSGNCATPDPFTAIGGGTCWGGGWLPPGMVPPGASPTPPVTPPPSAPPVTPPPVVAPPVVAPPAAPPSGPGNCATPDPFTALGGGTCWLGGWLPPGMVPRGASPTPPSTAAPPTTTVPSAPPGGGGCTTPDPFSSIGGGTCWGGGWLPPGMLPPGASPTPPSAPAPLPTPPAGPSSPTPGAPVAPVPPNPCATPDPFVAIGGGKCVNGGWVPKSVSGG